MLDLRGIEAVVQKLNKDSQERGEIQITEGTKHTRYTYVCEGKTLFSFGLTRSPKLKSMTFHYIPKNMGITQNHNTGNYMGARGIRRT